MNKKFTAFFTGYNMSVNGNYAYGTVNGYETNANIAMMDASFPVRIHISFYATDENKRNIESAIRNLALKYFHMEFSPYGLSMGFNDITVNKLLNRLPSVLDTIFAILSSNGALKSDCCPVCGNPINKENSQTRDIDGYKITIDNDCVKAINSVISEENNDFETAPNNYFKGFLGAFIGGLAGAVLSIILNFVGFVSSVSVIVSIVLGTFLYQKFHGKPNKVMILIVSLTSMIMQAATIPAIYIAAAGIAAESKGISMSALEAFKLCMRDSQFSTLFYADLALVLLFSALGTVYEIFVLSKKIKRRKNI